MVNDLKAKAYDLVVVIQQAQQQLQKINQQIQQEQANGGNNQGVAVNDSMGDSDDILRGDGVQDTSDS